MKDWQRKQNQTNPFAVRRARFRQQQSQPNVFDVDWADGAGARNVRLHDRRNPRPGRRSTGRPQPRRHDMGQSGITNKAAADRILRDWAVALRDALDALRSSGRAQ